MESVQAIPTIVAFIICTPILIVLNRKSFRLYGGPLGRLWHKHIEIRLSDLQKLFYCPGVYTGFGLGMASAFLSLLIAALFFDDTKLVFQPTEPVGWAVYTAFIRAGLVEEFCKSSLALAGCFLLARPSRNLLANKQMNGSGAFLPSVVLITAGCGLGFAFIENILYVGQGFAMGLYLPVILSRLLAAIGHTLLSMLFGLFLVTAKPNAWFSRAILGLIAATLMHGLFDFFAFPPVKIAQTLAYAFDIVLLVLVVGWAFRIFPEWRPRSRRRISEFEHDPLSALYLKEFNYHLRHHNLEIKGMSGFNGAIAKNRDRQGSADSRDLLLMAIQNFPFESPETWKHSVEDTSEPVPGFIEYFLESRHAYKLPAPGEIFALTELSSALGLGSQASLQLGETQYRGPVPDELADDWQSFESKLSLALLEKNQASAVWDASIFANNLTTVDTDLRAAGVDLTNLPPLRVLEFHRVDPQISALRDGPPASEPQSSQHIYMSLGLKKLYGREFMLSFSHPFPQIRWLFLRLGACLPEQAPWLRDFHMHPVENSLYLGEPRGWLRAILPVMPFGPFRKLPAVLQAASANVVGAGKQNFSSKQSEVSQLLLLSVADASFAAQAGLEAYFQELAARGHSWHNNLWRPIWFQN